MGAPSPELCNLWLARAFNANDVDAAVAMYHPDASIVQVDQVHGGTKIARGADGIRETMAAYIGLKPHMDVVTHHTTVSGDFAMTRSQWLIRGTAKDGSTTMVHPSRHGSAPQASRWHMGVFHRPPLRRRFLVGHRRPAANGIAAVAELSQKIAGPPDIFFEIAALAPATTHRLAGCPMKETDVICPICSAGYQRIQLESREGRPGEYHCLICDHLLEVFDGAVEVAYRLTVQPLPAHGHTAHRQFSR